MCVDCVLASPGIAQADPDRRTPPEVVLSQEHKAYGRFKEITSKDKPGVNFVEDDSASGEDTEVCIAEWVDTPKDKPLTCSILKLSPGKRDEVKFTFDVTKCDKLFNVL
jgi:hypothetical protein